MSLRSNLHFFSCSRTYRAIDLLHTLVVSMFIGCVYLETIIFFGLSSGGREGEGRLGGIAWPVSSGGLTREKRKNQTASLSFLFTFSSTFISSNSNLSPIPNKTADKQGSNPRRIWFSKKYFTFFGWKQLEELSKSKTFMCNNHFPTLVLFFRPFH